MVAHLSLPRAGISIRRAPFCPGRLSNSLAFPTPFRARSPPTAQMAVQLRDPTLRLRPPSFRGSRRRGSRVFGEFELMKRSQSACCGYPTPPSVEQLHGRMDAGCCRTLAHRNAVSTFRLSCCSGAFLASGLVRIPYRTSPGAVPTHRPRGLRQHWRSPFPRSIPVRRARMCISLFCAAAGPRVRLPSAGRSPRRISAAEVSSRRKGIKRSNAKSRINSLNLYVELT
jgi:hypothetical protein